MPRSPIYLAALMASVGLMLLGWGMLVSLNRSAGELQPEALQQAAQAGDEINAEDADASTGR